MQAVTLVFEHVSPSLDSLTLNSADAHAHANGSRNQAGEHMADAVSSPVLARHGAANAALKLLDDLCMMATGNPLRTSCRLSLASPSPCLLSPELRLLHDCFLQMCWHNALSID